MVPQNLQYPEFVADQLLTSDNLNELFGYLDEQGRMTRTNLIGIGIVCGLEVVTAADGTSVKITKGTGVTSEGYLVSLSETTFTQRIDFDPEKEKYYDKFVDGSHHKKFNIWELKHSAAVEGAVPLDLAFLNGNGTEADKKVVLLFVELLSIGNKNCDPNSCDDKGITINVNIRALLARKADVDAFTLKAGTGSHVLNESYTALDELRIRRFDVINTRVATSAELFTAYQKILTPGFFTSVETALSSSWTLFSPIVGSEYNHTNPFTGLAASFNFINNGSISSNQLIHIQYFYDHFSDLIAAYDEFRIAGMEILSTCCPDSSLFPRHLLLDLAIPDTSKNYSQYRHYFIYSPLFQQKDLMGKLKSLFRRLVLIRNNFALPPVNGSNSNPDLFQRITPSLLDASPISKKAIPYYYRPNTPPDKPLYKYWSYEKTRASAADKNLSYNANEYASKNYILDPLPYDLEPYNFLRIEGHAGKSYVHVLRNLKRMIRDYRLPFDVIALNTDNRIYKESVSLRNSLSASKSSLSISTNVSSLSANLSAREDLGDLHCYFNDLEAIYESIRNEILCMLCKELRYYYEIPLPVTTTGIKRFSALSARGKEIQISKVSLFSICHKSLYKIRPDSFGMIIEEIYANVGDEGELGINEILEALGFKENDNGDEPDPTEPGTINPSLLQAITLMMPILELPIYIIRLSKLFTADLHAFDVEAYCKLHERMAARAASYKRGYSLISANERTSIKNSYLNYNKTVKSGATEKTAAAEEKPTGSVIGLVSETPGLKISTNLGEQPALQISSLASQQSGLAFYVLYTITQEDLFDHLDVIIYNCKCRALMGIRAEYLRRLAQLTALRQFQVFSLKHPGLQHKAGVTMGGTFIIVYHSSDTESKNDPDPVYEKISTDLAEGTVIADFYLPYLCYSDCPPIVYQVSDIKDEPLIVSLSLQPNPKTNTHIYSVEDNTPYKFTHSPDNGTLNNGTEANGVSTDGSGNFVFTPSKVKTLLGDNEKVEIGFTYSKSGVTSSEIKVTVYNTPQVDIIADPDELELPVGTTVNFTGLVKYADKFSWKINGGDELSSTSELKDQKFNDQGTFTITLAVVQTPTGISASKDYTIKVLQDPTVSISVSPTLPQVISVDDTYTFTSNVQDADSFKWLENNLQISTSKDLGARRFGTPGTFRIKLEVFNSVTGKTATSNEIVVTVRSLPLARIETVPAQLPSTGVPVGQKITFNSAATDADIFAWTLKDPAGATKTASTVHFGEIEFNIPGTHSVGLKVSQSNTGKSATADPVSVFVLKPTEPGPVKTCENLDSILKSYSGLSSIDPQNFQGFNGFVLEEMGINLYFKKLSGVAGGTLAEQIKFFVSDLTNGNTIVVNLVEWMNFLTEIITSDSQKNLRLLALETYRILAALARYIACIQKDDIDKATVQTLRVFTVIPSHLKAILASSAVMTIQETERIKQMQKDFSDENKRQEVNNTIEPKPVYLDALKRILAQF